MYVIEYEVSIKIHLLTCWVKGEPAALRCPGMSLEEKAGNRNLFAHLLCSNAVGGKKYINK